MRELGLTGLSDDGRFLVAHDSLTDESFLIPTDIRLTSLLDTSSPSTANNPDPEPGPREPSMETTLSPRDIQTRIRRGESPEQVAEASGMPLEKVRGFAVPVIAEREFIVEQARITPVRQLRSSGGPGQMLGVLVDESLASAGMTPDSADWDSWRREDGKWTIVVATDIVPGPATFLFDVKGRYVVAADDAALELIGDFVQQPEPEPAAVDVVRETPAVDLLQAEAASGIELEGPVLTPSASAAESAETAELVDEPGVDLIEEPSDDLIEAELESSIVQELADESAEAFDLAPEEYFEPGAPVSSLKEARERRALEQLAMSIEAEAAPNEVSDVEITEEHDLPITEERTHPSKRKHERRRVPSWDEIMFGGRQE